MKTKLVVLLLCCIGGSELQAQTTSFHRLNTVSIVAEDLSSDAEKLGITREDLESVAMVGLKSKLPKITVGRTAMSYVYVNVTLVCSDYACAANTDVSLNRPTTVLEDDDHTQVGSQWRMCGIRTRCSSVQGTRCLTE